MNKTSYYLFGCIRLWSVKRDYNEDGLYAALSKRFKEELDAAVERQRR